MSREPKKPRVPESRGYLWKALRLRRSATAREIATITERPKKSVQVDLRYLRRTGYVRLEGKTFVLIRDSGPKPPMYLFDTDHQLIGAMDRNDQQIYGVDGKKPPASIRHRGNWVPKVKPGKGHRESVKRRVACGMPRRRVLPPYIAEKLARGAE
jgi:hypothetical protein